MLKGWHTRKGKPLLHDVGKQVVTFLSFNSLMVSCLTESTICEGSIGIASWERSAWRSDVFTHQSRGRSMATSYSWGVAIGPSVTSEVVWLQNGWCFQNPESCWVSNWSEGWPK